MLNIFGRFKKNKKLEEVPENIRSEIGKIDSLMSDEDKAKLRGMSKKDLMREHRRMMKGNGLRRTGAVRSAQSDAYFRDHGMHDGDDMLNMLFIYYWLFMNDNHIDPSLEIQSYDQTEWQATAEETVAESIPEPVAETIPEPAISETIPEPEPEPISAPADSPATDDSWSDRQSGWDSDDSNKSGWDDSSSGGWDSGDSGGFDSDCGGFD